MCWKIPSIDSVLVCSDMACTVVGPFQPENWAACLPDALEPKGRWVCSQSPREVCCNFSVGHLRQLSSVRDCRQEVYVQGVRVLVGQLCGPAGDYSPEHLV